MFSLYIFFSIYKAQTTECIRKQKEKHKYAALPFSSPEVSKAEKKGTCFLRLWRQGDGNLLQRVCLVCIGAYIRICVYVLVCEDGVVNFLRLSRSVSLQVYGIVFDITHTKLPIALC